MLADACVTLSAAFRALSRLLADADHFSRRFFVL